MSQSGTSDSHELSAEELAAIEKKYDEGAQIRTVSSGVTTCLRIVAVVFAFYHYLTAGFGLPPDHWHMGWHLAGLFILTYAFHPIIKNSSAFKLNTSGWAAYPTSIFFSWCLAFPQRCTLG